MNARRGMTLATGVIAGVLSLAAAVWAGSLQTRTMLLLASRPAQMVPPPPEYVPANVTIPPAQPPLTHRQRVHIRDALWRSPLDQQLVDYLYVDAVRTAGGGAATLPLARLLADLGWRYTPAQQNLMLRAAVDGRYADVIDQADALLRRQKLTDQAMAILMAMEAIPQVHHLVVDRLLGDPMWSYDYLLRIGQQSLPQVIDARFRTLRVLLRTPDSVSRAELAPALQALIANGRGRDADTLWTMKAGPRPRDNVLRDGDFRMAAQLAGEETYIPFEWKMNQDLGYSADPGGQGALINWDGRGVPVFMVQLVPVESGRRYTLSIKGKADTGKLQVLLAPILDCGATKIAFVPFEGQSGTAHFRSMPIPVGCNMATLAVGGDIDAGRRPVSMDLARLMLRPSN